MDFQILKALETNCICFCFILVTVTVTVYKCSILSRCIYLVNLGFKFQKIKNCEINYPKKV